MKEPGHLFGDASDGGGPADASGAKPAPIVLGETAGLGVGVGQQTLAQQAQANMPLEMAPAAGTMVVERIDVSGKWWPMAAPAILGAVCAVAGINLWNALLDPPAGMEEGTLAGDGARLLLGAFLLLNIGAVLAQLMPFPAHVRNRVLKTAVPTVVIGSILQLGILCCMFLYLICWVGTSALWGEQKMEPERLGVWMGLGALVGLLFGYVSAYFVL